MLKCIESILSVLAVCDARLNAGPLGPRCLPYSLVAMTTDWLQRTLNPSSQTRLEESLRKLNAYHGLFKL